MSGPAGRTKLMALSALGALCLDAAPASAAQAPPAAPVSAPAGELPPLQFGAIDDFVGAIGIEEWAAHTIDAFWQPAIEALVAGNRGKAAEARAFAAGRRGAELAIYRPLVAFMLDRRVVEILNPRALRQLETLQAGMQREIARTGEISRERQLVYARRTAQIRAEPARRVNGQLEAMTRLAQTPDGAALRELNRRGLFWCVDPRRGPRATQAHPECAGIGTPPVLQRLRNTPSGEALLQASAFAYGQLAGLVAMTHDPGISLHLLLPPEEVRAAGLDVPADLSFEELTARSGDESPQG